MKRLKPVHISILVIVVFLAALFLGMQSNWWQLEGRKTPSDFSIDFGANNDAAEHEDAESGTEIEATEEEHSEDEEDHETTSVAGSSTVQDAIDLGIPLEKIEEILAGEVEDKDQLIKTIVTERGLKFGEVKDALNALLR
ncbi:MAG: hypothetical protein AB1Z23_02280 [Eubacteriales bacterium]